MKRVFSLTLAAILICSLCSVFAGALSGVLDGDFGYTVSEDGARIIEYRGTASSLTIPQTLGGHTVVAIGREVFCDNEYLTEITIPDTVKYIETAAFAYCYDLVKVTLPASLESVGEGGFAYCDALEAVTFPEGLKSIGKMAFFDCEQLKSVHIPRSVAEIGESAFSLCRSNTEFTVDDQNAYFSAEDGVLYNKDKTVLMYYPVSKADETFDVPDSVKKIDSYAFYNALNIQRVNMYEVENIGDYAFCECKKLSSVQIPIHLRTIGTEAFQSTALKSISVPETVISIGTHAFGYEHNYKENVYLALTSFQVCGKKNSVAEWCAKKNGFSFFESGVSCKGDFDSNEKVDVLDIALMRAGIIGTVVLTPEAQDRCDINNDGVMNIIDVAGVRCWIANFQ